ncbi:uncharacterized protein LOC120337160 isoform X1 [Styela clava]
MVKSDCKDELDRHKPDTSWDANFPCNSYPENTTECVGPPTLKTTTTQPTTSANVETTSQSRTESLTLETSTTDKTEPFTVSNLETSTGTIDVISTSTELVDITEVTTTATSGEQMTTKIETSTATSGDQNTTKMDSSTATSDDQTSEIVDTSTADLTTDTAEKSTTTDGSTASPFLATTEGSITSNAIQMQSTEASTTSKSITSAQTDTTITNQYTEAMKTDEITTEPIVEISLTISTTATPTMIETTNLENAGVSTATSRPEMTESDIATPTPLSATPGILVTTTKESITTGIVDTTTESTVPFVASSTTTVTSQTPTAGTTSEKLLQTTFKPTSVSTTQLSIINEETTAVVTSLSTTVESTEDTNLTTELASTVAMTTDQTTVISEITTLIKTLSPEPTTMKDMTIIFPTTNPPVTITETKSTSVTSPTPVTSSVTTHTASLSTVQLTTTEGMISSTAPILVATYTTSSPTDELSTVGEINEQSTGIETTSTLGTTEVQTTTRNTVEQIFSSPATNISVTEEAPATAPFSTETSAISQEILSVTTQTSTDVIEGQTTEENEAPTISIDSESVAAEITSLVATTSKPFSTDTSAISRDILTVTSQVSSGVTEERIMTKTEPSTTSVNSESTTKSVTQTSPNTLDIASTQQQSSNSEIMESTTTNQSEVEKQTSKPNDTTSLPAITENTTLYPSSIATSSTSTTEEDIETSMATTSSIMNDIATFSRDDTQAITTANVEFLRTTSSGSQTTQTTPLVNETNKANDFSSTSLTGQTQTTKPLDTTSTNEITSVFSGTEQMSFATADITGSETSAVFNTTVQGNVNNSSASSTTKELQTDFTVNSSTTRNTESTTEESSTLSMVLSTTNGEKETTSLQPDATTRILLETTTSGPTSATSNFTTSLISDSSGINTETSRLSTSTNSSSTTELMTRLGYVITAVSESRETVSTAEANTIETLVEVTSSSGSSQSMFPTTTLFEALTQNSTLSTFSPSEIELTYTQNNITKFAELTTTNVKETTDSSMTSETTLPQENATQANLEFTRLDNNSSPQFNTEGDFASTITSASNEIAQNSVTNTILSGTTANPPSDLTSSQYNTMEVTDTTTSSSENTTNLVSASETGRAIIDSVTKLPEISTSTFVVTSQEQTSSKDSTEQSNLVEALVEETSRTTSTPAISETIFASTEQSSSATSSFSIQTTSKSDTTEVVELSTTENIQITVTQAIGTEAFIDTNSTVISDITIRTTNTVSIIPETMKSDNTTIIDVVLQSTTTVPTVSDRSTIESTSMAATNSLQVDNSTSDVPFTSVAESTSNVFATSGTDIAPTSTVIPSTLPSSSELPLKQNSTSANTTVIANDTSLLGGSRPIEITSESNSVGTWTHSTSSSPIAQTTESQLSVSQPIPSSVPVRNNTAPITESTIVNFEETSSTQSTIPSASSIEDSTSQATAFETATRLSLRTSETSTRNDTDATNINVEQTSSRNESPTMESANLSTQTISPNDAPESPTMESVNLSTQSYFPTDAPNTDTVRVLPTNEATTTLVSTNAISTRRETTVTRSTSYKTTGTTEMNSFITSTVIASSNPSVIVEKVSGVPTTVRIEGLEGATSISTTTASTDFDDISSFPNSNKTDNITETTSSYDSTPDASTYFENEQYTSEEPPVTTINGLFTTLPVSTAAQTSPGKSSGTSMQTKMASPVESTTPATVLTSQKTIFLSTDSMDKWMLSTTNSVTQPITTSVASTDATSATITSVGSTTSVGLTTPLTVMTSQDTMLFNTGPGDESILSTTNSITEPITTSSTLSSATSTSATAFTNIVSQSTTTQSDSNTRNESNLAETTVSSTALLTDEITQEVTVTQQVPTSTTSDVTSIDETQTANLEYPSTTISFNEIPSSSVINGIRTPTATSSITEQTSQSTRETTMPTETTIISTTQTSSKAVTQSQQQTTGYTQSIASSTVSEILLNETSTSQNSFVTSATTSTDGIETLTPSGSSAGSNFENSISTDSTATVFEIETTSTNTFQTTETLLATTNVLTETTPNASACSSEKTGTDPSGYILWPTTNSGSVAVSSCPTPTSKTATRVCNSSNWGAPDTSACTQLSPRSRELQDIDRTTIVAGNAATLANQILNVTSNEKDSLVAYDLQLVSNILLKVVNVIGEENNYDITSDVINSVSNVIEAPSEELRVASQEFSSNSRLVQVIDNVLLKLEVLTDQNVYLDSKNVKVAVAGISGNQTFTGKSFTLSSNLQPGISDGTDSGDNSGQASVFIPPSIREKVTSSFTRIQFAVYTSTALFNHVRVDDGTVPGLGSNMNVSVYSDHVVSASVGNTKITGLSENVTITISRSNSYYGKGPHCVFYNFPNNGGEGSWSAEGCHLNPVSTSTTTICDCNHLTNFAVIMDVYGTVEYFNEYQNMILQILTYIGCSLSIFGLLCTLISYLMFEKLRKEVPAKILICLCAALITVNIVYLCLQSAYYSSHTTCVAIAAIMHYALLSSLMWMGLEAINMYIALVKVFNTYYRKYMLKMSLAGWGVPLLIVLIAFIVQFATGIPSYEMNSKTEICWLRKDVFYGTLVAPFAIVFLLNSVIYCLVLAQLLGMSSRKLKHLDSARKLKKPAKRENFRKLRGAIGLMALLGISWGFALGTFDKAALTFAYVFVVFNSSQGFWVFIFHCVLKKEVSKCWKKLIFNKGTFRDGSSRWSRFSSSNTRGSRSTTTSSARSMSASSIRTSYLVPKPSKSVDRSEASIGMDSKGLDVVTRTNSTANPVFDDPDIGPPPPFPPPPIPTEERIVRRVPRRTSPQPSTTISTQTDINLLHSSDTDSQNSMESMENSRQDEQNMEDEERRDSVNNNFGLPGIQGFQFPDHREVVISPSNESGIYSDASVSSTAILVEMPTYMDLESNNNEVSALRNNDVRGHHSGEINLGYEDDTLDDVTIISNDVTLINSGVKDNVDIVERHGGVNSRPHQRYAVKETKSDSTPGTPRIKGTNSLTDDARNTDSGISISSDATGAGSSTAGSTRSDRPELVTQDSRSSLYSVNSNTSSASGPSSGSESSYQIGRVRDRESSGDLPSPHLWKAPLVIKRSDDHTKANKKEGIFRRKPVITGPNNNGSTKRALWKRSRNNSKDNSTEKQSMNSFPPKRKLKRQPNKSENCDKSEGATNKLDIQMTNFSLNRGSFHDGAL